MLLPLVLVAAEEQLLGVLVQLHVQSVQALDAPAHLLADADAGGPSAVDLRKRSNEAQAKRPLEQILRLALKLRQAVEGHVAQVGLGAGQQHVAPLQLAHGRHVVAAHQAEVRQHAHLSVIGQVRGAVHEVRQGHAGPVVSAVAGGQLVLSGRTSVAHVQSRFPRGSALDVFPLAQVPGHGVS
ncbi:hypothetical protein NQD34_001014, partial [Periophthalmus magnuspinnatus]